MNELNFKINGFHCESCVKVSTMKIKKINGVENLSIGSDGTANLSSNRLITLEDIALALDGLGYTVTSA